MRFLVLMRHRLILLPLLLVAIGATHPLPAQAQAYTLVVTLHDAGGRALVGVAVIVRDEAGQELVRATSDANGAVSFPNLPGVVRVAVAGQSRGGPGLYQLGDDAQGVRLDLGQGSGPAILNLRVERDGLVLPDPATMLTLEEGGPTARESVPMPTALIATPAPLPTLAAPAGAGVVSVGGPQAQGHRDGWVPLATLLVVALAAGVMLLAQRRRDAR
jgi:hypothetical protein